MSILKYLLYFNKKYVRILKHKRSTISLSLLHRKKKKLSKASSNPLKIYSRTISLNAFQALQ